MVLIQASDYSGTVRWLLVCLSISSPSTVPGGHQSHGCSAVLLELHTHQDRGTLPLCSWLPWCGGPGHSTGNTDSYNEIFLHYGEFQKSSQFWEFHRWLFIILYMRIVKEETFLSSFTNSKFSGCSSENYMNKRQINKKYKEKFINTFFTHPG